MWKERVMEQGLWSNHCPQINLVQCSSTVSLGSIVRQRKMVQLFYGAIIPVESQKTKCLPGQMAGHHACSSHSISNLKMETPNIKARFSLGTCFLLLLTSISGAGITGTGCPGK